MAFPPLPPSQSESGLGFNLNQLLDLVSNLESSGQLEEFSRNNPQYLVGIEVARVILQRNKAGATCCSGIPGSQACSPGAPPCVIRSCPTNESVRYFVVHLCQLLQELCPNRNDPNIVASEDRCLAALQMAIVDCLKIVRQMRYSGTQPIGLEGGPSSQHLRALPSRLVKQQPSNFNFAPNPPRTVQQEDLPPPRSFDITASPNSIDGCLAQRLETIPNQPCPTFGQYQALNSEMSRRPMPIGTLEQRLDAIPQPCPCPTENPVVAAAMSCGMPRTQHSHDRERNDTKRYKPVAGGWSDGVGGNKIKGLDDTAGSGKAKQGVLDGQGGRKPKDMVEE